MWWWCLIVLLLLLLLLMWCEMSGVMMWHDHATRHHNNKKIQDTSPGDTRISEIYCIVYYTLFCLHEPVYKIGSWNVIWFISNAMSEAPKLVTSCKKNSLLKESLACVTPPPPLLCLLRGEKDRQHLHVATIEAVIANITRRRRVRAGDCAHRKQSSKSLGISETAKVWYQ